MAEKAQVPAIRFKGFTEAWEQRKFADMAIRNSEMAVCSSELPSVEYEDIISGQGILNKDVREKPSIKTGIRFSSNDVLFGKLRPYLKNWFLPDFSGVAVGDFWVLHPFETDSRYLYYLIQTPAFQTAANQSTGTKMPRSDWNLVSKTEFLLPKDIAEQRKIGATLQTIDNLITLHQRKLSKLQNVKKAMLEKMFPKNGSDVPEIRFSGFTEAWEQRKLSELGAIVTGSTPSTQIKAYYSDSGIPWVTPTDISDNITYITEKNLSNEGQNVARVVPKNTILVTSIASIGKNTMLGTKGSFNQQINGLVPNELDFHPYFLLTESTIWSEEMKRSAASGTMQIVNKTEFSKINTYVPTLNEQKQIGEYFKNIDTLITLHQRKLEKLQNLKKACLEKMFV